MKSKYDDAIFKEDMNLLLDTLTSRTLLKNQVWICDDYTPISFVDTSDLDEARADISHTFYASTVMNDQLFSLELTESISLPSEKGDIMGSVHYENEFGPHKYEFRLSEDFKYGDCSAGNIVLRYRTSPILPFTKATVNSLVHTAVVRNSYSDNYKIMEKEINFWKRSTTGPLMQLIEGLMIERNPLRFHQIILNKSYRTKLFPQYNLSI